MKLIFLLIVIAAIFYWISLHIRKSRKYTRISKSFEAPIFKRAIGGTFDESYFINPETGRFCFPKYRTNKTSIVQIKDITNYKEDMWYDLDTNEKKNFSIADFEFNFVSADIEIDDFWLLFNQRNRKHLGVYQYLSGHGQELEELIFEFEDRDYSYHIFATKEWMKKLIDNGCLKCCTFESKGDKQAYMIEYLNSIKVPELKDICSKSGIKTSLNKQGLINQIISSGIELDFPYAVEENELFKKMMDNFYQLYVDDVHSSIDKWHPFIIKEVWENIVGDTDSSGVAKKVREIITSKYWENRLREQTIGT